MSKKHDEDLIAELEAILSFEKEQKSTYPSTAKKKSKITMSMDEYVSTLPSDYFSIALEAKINSFPDLYQIRGVKNDRDSTEIALAATQPVRVLTALYEAEYRASVAKKNKRIKH